MDSLKRKRKRTGRCYELAGDAMLNEPGSDDFILVHGVVRGELAPVGHAWILTPDGRAYDAVTDEYMPAAEYVEKLAAVIERRYTKLQMANAMRAAGHWGPWHETAGLGLEDERSKPR